MEKDKLKDLLKEYKKAPKEFQQITGLRMKNR